MSVVRSSIRFLFPAMLAISVCAPGVFADAIQSDRLMQSVRPLISSLVGREKQFQITGRISLPIDGKSQSIDLRVTRFDDESFDLVLTHADYAVEVRRRSDITALALPKHGTVYLGRGEVAAADRLSPLNLMDRLNSGSSTFAQLTPVFNLLANSDIESALRGILPAVDIQYDAEKVSWQIDRKYNLQLPEEGAIRVDTTGLDISLKTSTTVLTPLAADQWGDMKIVDLDRDELERTLLRGVRRAAEILKPSQQLTQPEQKNRSVVNGELRWIDGQRVAILRGTPDEIGRAHGQLLREESRRCIESVLYAFGTVHVISTGRWFRHDLEDAWVRLAPHIPERHKVETRALAAALEQDPQVVQVLNVFPELFHCSGFAVFGSATSDGKLYHGRVLDYMTTIGLQDAATTFIVAAEGQIPFANVGYAGFIGSVSGMNLEAVSLGEMGGRGEGNWDGVPMATLMRRALEECHTLEEVKALWADSPRTCEYYYVFADGKTNKAVGVAATPEKIEFIDPGQAHELLGEGIPDAVVLSAGSRLQELRRRVTEKHGKIDQQTAQWLMSRPVAMQSNLHNVLFVPQDGILYVANAGHDRPAAEMPYVRLDLRQLLKLAAETAPPVAAVP